MKIPLASATYEGRYRSLSAQKRINWIVEVDRTPERSPVAVAPRPGLKLWKESLGSQSIRGLHTIQQGASAGAALYVVMGSTLYSIDQEKTATSLGTLNSGSDAVTMEDNGVDLVISDGQYQSSTAETYVYETDTSTFKKLNDSTDAGYDSAAPRSSHAVFLDSYILLNSINTGEFYISASDDASSWDGTYATAESNPDNLIAMAALRGELWLFGELGTEVWANEAAAGMPFSPIRGASIEYGCSAPRSVAKAEGRLLWLAKNRQGQHRVVMTEGYQALPISDAKLEYHLGTYATFTDAVGFTFFLEGHTFYVLSFPTANATWVYDLATGFWGEWQTASGRWLAGCYAFAFNKHLVGDYQTGNIYELDLQTYTDNTTAITRTLTTPHLTNDRGYLFCDYLEAEFEPGIGAPTGQGSDPQAMLRVSRDGAMTWGNEHWRSVGAQGNYLTRARWPKLGRSRDFVFELTVSDPVKWVLLGLTAKIRPGR